MDTAGFKQLQRQLEQVTSTDDKLLVLSSSHGNFSANQLVFLFQLFPQIHDEVKVTQRLKSRLCPMTCAEAADVLEAVSYSDKMQILEIISRSVTDASSGFKHIEDQFNSRSEKSMAKEMMSRASENLTAKAKERDDLGGPAASSRAQHTVGMDERSFSQLEQKLKSALFIEDKLAVLSQSKGSFSADQVYRVFQTLPQVHDEIKALRALQERLCPMSCAEAVCVLEAVPYSDKLKVLDIIARSVGGVL
ncbi:uncharacterized protein LOC118420602 [Branchiostoma floridae]|uniref:Uncharacterized protein LOC118420602 n=1 Tax=Branchiostoma floridae TaxID=7739 RepID=A0A9J7LKC2_BRAFL|nr:uncharacterized protein LOC118420602 [Branchiostoma floridae]